MAGIGFRLQRLLEEGSYSSTFRAYLYAAAIGSGPLVLSVASLALLGAAIRPFGGTANDLFFAAVTATYSASMILASAVQVVTVRKSADADYIGQRQAVWPVLERGLGVVVPAHLIAGCAFYFWGIEAPPLFRAGGVFLSVMVGAMWLLAGLLSGLKNYRAVAASFAAGYVASFAGGWAGFRLAGEGGLMAGFALGHAVLVIALLACIRRELPGGRVDPLLAEGSLEGYRLLAIGGMVYSAGIWADKYLFWYLGEGRLHVNGVLYAMPLHDQAVYLGFLSIIPGMAVFLLRFETEFATHYAEFFRRVTGRAPLAAIEESRAAMVGAVWGEILQIVKYQGGFTLVLILTADRVMPVLGLGALQTGVFQIILVGSFLLVVFLSFLTVLYYLDEQLSALVACVVFAATNAGVTALTIFSGAQWFGLGYVAACAAGLAVASKFADDHLRTLTWETFCRQPLV